MIQVRVMEDTLGRLRATAREWQIGGWETMTAAALREAIAAKVAAEAGQERRQADHARHLRQLRQQSGAW